MRKLTRSQQNFLKTIHLISVCVWVTGVLILALMPILHADIESGDALYMYNRIYHFIDIRVLTPAAIATLLTGFVYSAFTSWGFFRHGWLVYKWLATLFIVLTGTFYLGPMVTAILHVADARRLAALQDASYLAGAKIGLWAAIVNTVLLLAAIAASVYKPWRNWRGAASK
ncbi:MAG: hypothetical protein AB7D39_00370 [Pseudodesulfovibrio sp.]|uniref:hypothetical protein n=1 Tax=Pseudodesulfovibrio sp. TaxID=2035812 RepID=UPI003D09B035